MQDTQDRQLNGQSAGDISSLVDQASKEMHGVEPARVQRARQRAPAKSIRYVFMALFLLVIVSSVRSVISAFMPPPVDQVAADLQTIVRQAQASVDEVYASEGQYPDAIPVAALAAVVVYMPEEGGYRLSVTAGRVEATLESDGSITIRK